MGHFLGNFFPLNYIDLISSGLAKMPHTKDYRQCPMQLGVDTLNSGQNTPYFQDGI